MEIFVAQLLNGLSLGSIYVLLVLGFNLMLVVAKIIQFAYPHLVVLSMYVCWGTLKYTNNMFLVVLASIVSCVIVNVAIEPIFRALAKKHGLDINVSFVVSISIALLITDVMSHALNYGFPIAFPTDWVGKSILSFGLIAFTCSSHTSIRRTSFPASASRPPNRDPIAPDPTMSTLICHHSLHSDFGKRPANRWASPAPLHSRTAGLISHARKRGPND
jgi:branched-subunit amino acid ABC-type transport system permease component